MCPDASPAHSKLMRAQMQQHASIQQSFASRAQAESDASGAQTPRNRLWSGALERLLEDRLEARTAHDLATLAREYNVDVEVLERTARVVNVVSVRKGSERRGVDGEGNEWETREVRGLFFFPCVRVLERLLRCAIG